MAILGKEVVSPVGALKQQNQLGNSLYTIIPSYSNAKLKLMPLGNFQCFSKARNSTPKSWYFLSSKAPIPNTRLILLDVC